MLMSPSDRCCGVHSGSVADARMRRGVWRIASACDAALDAEDAGGEDRQLMRLASSDRPPRSRRLSQWACRSVSSSRSRSREHLARRAVLSGVGRQSLVGHQPSEGSMRCLGGVSAAVRCGDEAMSHGCVERRGRRCRHTTQTLTRLMRTPCTQMSPSCHEAPHIASGSWVRFGPCGRGGPMGASLETWWSCETSGSPHARGVPPSQRLARLLRRWVHMVCLAVAARDALIEAAGERLVEYLSGSPAALADRFG